MCGEWVKRDDTTSTCPAESVRFKKKNDSLKAREQAIATRMAQREAKFKAAQARDERAMYELSKLGQEAYRRFMYARNNK